MCRNGENMTEAVQKLLNNVGKISDKHETMAKATGGNFNIFEITEISRAEVYMCKILYELLNPEGRHYQGNVYLKLFFETIKKNHGDKFNLKTPDNAKVLKEECIEGLKRIDITIDDIENRQYLPIEVKIDAQDQKNQCRDYFNKTKRSYEQKENARLCYLTKEGHLPTEESLGDLPESEKEQIIAISWKKDILEWISSCIAHPNTVAKAPIREILIQYKKAVQKFTNQLKEDEQMDIERLIIESQNNFKNAEKIAKCLEVTKKNLWNELCKAIKAEINFTPTLSDDWHLYYELSKAKNQDKCTAVGIWIAKQMDFYSLGIVENNEENNQKFTEVKGLYENIPIFELIGEENFDKIVQDCIERINKVLE